MRAISLILVQLFASFSIVALVMPGILYVLPSTRAPVLGQGIALGLIAALFVLLRCVWPRRTAN